MKIDIYLNFNGNTEEAFNFYKSVFGGEFTALQRFGDTPEAGNVAPEDKDKLMHISLPIGSNIVLMATDALESMGQTLTIGNNVYISINADSTEEADILFKNLSEGGIIEMPMEKAFWNAYFGSFTDRFGIRWMISADLNEASSSGGTTAPTI